jgi:hypothetical protein
MEPDAGVPWRPREALSSAPVSSAPQQRRTVCRRSRSRVATMFPPAGFAPPATQGSPLCRGESSVAHAPVSPPRATASTPIRVVCDPGKAPTAPHIWQPSQCPTTSGRSHDHLTRTFEDTRVPGWADALDANSWQRGRGGSLGQAPRGHSSMLDVTLSAKGMASPHSSIISSCRISSNFLNGSLFL